MALVCREIEERVEETVWEPVEEYVERREQRCKERSCKKWCLCCNKWFCWIEVIVTKVVTWVAKTVVNFVMRTVCEVVSDVLSAAIDILVGIVRVVVAVLVILWNVVTLDWNGVRNAWRDLLAALTDLGTGLLDLIKLTVRVLTGGYVAGWIREKVDQYRLKRYVRERLEEVFGGDPARLAAIKESINLDFGPFGLEFRAESLRTFVDSRAAGDDGEPLLLQLHESGDLNLLELASVDNSAALDRPRTVARLVTGESLTRTHIERYIESGGAEPHFLIHAVTGSGEREKLNVAEDKGRQIGLKLKWKRNALEVRGMSEISPAMAELVPFLLDPVGRSRTGSDVCNLVSVAVFTTAPGPAGRRPFGFAAAFTPTSPVSGVVHRDRLPTAFFKYVLIHEIGHYFSLQHEGHDGLDKIMYSPVENHWWSWNLILEFLWWSGEPRFTLDDGKRTWDFLIDQIAGCLPGAAVGRSRQELTAEDRAMVARARVEE